MVWNPCVDAEDTQTLSQYHKVILIGGDHHNCLELVREFARHGIAAYGVIVGITELYPALKVLGPYPDGRNE